MDQLSLCGPTTQLGRQRQRHTALTLLKGTGITPEMLVPAIMQELAVLPIEKKVFYTIFLSPSGTSASVAALAHNFAGRHFEKMREAVQLLLRVSWPMFVLTARGTDANDSPALTLLT